MIIKRIILWYFSCAEKYHNIIKKIQTILRLRIKKHHDIKLHYMIIRIDILKIKSVILYSYNRDYLIHVNI